MSLIEGRSEGPAQNKTRAGHFKTIGAKIQDLQLWELFSLVTGRRRAASSPPHAELVDARGEGRGRGQILGGPTLPGTTISGRGINDLKALRHHFHSDWRHQALADGA
jgi:hypothetical protein